MRPSLWFFISLPPNFSQILDVCGLPPSLILVSRKKYNFEYIFFGCRRVQKRKDLTNRFDVTDDRTFNQVDEVVNVLDRYTVCLTYLEFVLMCVSFCVCMKLSVNVNCSYKVKNDVLSVSNKHMWSDYIYLLLSLSLSLSLIVTSLLNRSYLLFSVFNCLFFMPIYDDMVS